MKKDTFGTTWSWNSFYGKRLFKLKILFLAVLSICTFTNSNAQEKRFDVSFKNTSFKEVLTKLEKESGYLFFAKHDKSIFEKKVDLDIKNATVFEVLDDLLKAFKLRYEVVDKYITIIDDKNSDSRSLKIKSIKGKVVDQNNLPMPGVSVLLKGTKNGTVTDLNGNYTLSNVSENSVLLFSFVGMKSQEKIVGTSTDINAKLLDETIGLGEVVVTAMGIERSQKSLTYTSQKIGGEDITTVKDANLMNGLTGKMAGVVISRSNSGTGGSTKILLRGNRSLSGSSSPLIVIDGVPVSNRTAQQPGDTWGGGAIDAGDGLSNINPDDIKSINILKGASASALYGSSAANGVIMITTKSGSNGTKIDFSSNTTFETPFILPELQNSYGTSPTNQLYSWGPNTTTIDDNRINDYLQTGATYINSISLSSGNENLQNFISYSNTSSKGLIPTSGFKQHTFTLKNNATFFNEKLKVVTRVNYTSQKGHNRVSQGLFLNPLTSLYMHPRDKEINKYINDFETPNPANNGTSAQNWPLGITDFQQNPGWVTNRNPVDNSVSRLIGNISLKYDISKNLNIMTRGNMDWGRSVLERKYYVGSFATFIDKNGRYTYDESTSYEYFFDALLNYNFNIFEKLNVSGLVGSSLRHLGPFTSIGFDSKGSKFNNEVLGLAVPNFFNLVAIGAESTKSQNVGSHREIQSVFAAANFAYNDMLMLDLTARNDWDSNLAPGKLDFFYPSIGLSAIVNEIVSLPKEINFFKLRGSFAEVGSSLSNYIANGPVHSVTTRGEPVINRTGLLAELKPQLSKSIEFGLETRVFNDLLSLDLTYYKTNTINQLMSLPAPAGSSYAAISVNAGDIQNEGFEAVLNANILRKTTVKWQSTLNFSTNRNIIVALHPELKGRYPISGNFSYQTFANEGESFGDIYVKSLEASPAGGYVGQKNKITGRITLNSLKDFVKVGNYMPDYLLGWNNGFSYKNFKFNMLLDARIGGEVMSLTQAMMDGYGVSKITGDIRDNGGMVPIEVRDKDGVLLATEMTAEDYYTSVGGREGASAKDYVYDATNIRIRELAVGYKFKFKSKFVKDIQVSLIGRNVLMLYNKAPFDPEMVSSTGNALLGLDAFGLPATRSIGFNLSMSF